MTSTALLYPGNRVQLAALPGAAAAPVLEVAFVGYCHAGRWDPDADRAVAALGLVPAMGYVDQPVPVDAWDAFLAIFGPDAGASTKSIDTLPGERFWLAGAVADFFAAGGKRAWIVRVAEQDIAPEDAHVPQEIAVPGIGAARGLAAACAVPTLGLVALPDLERLYAVPRVKAALPPPVPVPLPVFRPQGAVQPASLPQTMAQPVGVTPASGASDILRRITRTLATLRPDVTALFTLPVGLDAGTTISALETEALRLLYGEITGTALPQVQPVLPLLYGSGGGISTPSGLLAGTIAATSEREGVWRSIAGRPIATTNRPVRRIGDEGTETLRLNGVAALHPAPEGVVLETEALATPFDEAARAAPTRRFIGWLHRQLQQYGDGLVFENDPQDGHVELVLAGFFAELFRRGALKARRLSDAFSVRRVPAAEGAIAFEIRFSPSFAIDTIVLRLVQDADGALAVKAAA